MSTLEQYALLWLTVVLMACVFNIGMLVGIWVVYFIHRKESK